MPVLAPLSYYNETYTGRQYGKWQVLGGAYAVGEGRTKRIMLQCRCVCGTEADQRLASLRDGSTTQCRPCRNKQQRTGVGGTWFSRLVRDAHKRGYEVSVTPAQLNELFEKQGRRCALSGMELRRAAWRGDIHSPVNDTASLDRIDNTRGYVPGNVQWVHKRLNIMKLTMTQDEFVGWCRLVAEHVPVQTAQGSDQPPVG